MKDVLDTNNFEYYLYTVQATLGGSNNVHIRLSPLAFRIGLATQDCLLDLAATLQLHQYKTKIHEEVPPLTNTVITFMLLLGPIDDETEACLGLSLVDFAQPQPLLYLP
jgi:hypothetical protein